VNAYRRSIWPIVAAALAPHGRLDSALDFGAGDGWFAAQFETSGLARRVTAVDVQVRERCFKPVEYYDGQRLPFADRSFDLVYAVDVLHHCPDPSTMLAEMLRCSRQWVLIKDHTYRNCFGWSALCVLDEIGNRRFGVPSRYQYQRGWDWLPAIEAAGYREQTLIYPARCHRGPLGYFTRRLNFVGLWRRASDA
jgi:ubiquinone/menaquinone biosynthesis C-methylase UbiE